MYRISALAAGATPVEVPEGRTGGRCRPIPCSRGQGPRPRLVVSFRPIPPNSHGDLSGRRSRRGWPMACPRPAAFVLERRLCPSSPRLRRRQGAWWRRRVQPVDDFAPLLQGLTDGRAAPPAVWRMATRAQAMHRRADPPFPAGRSRPVAGIARGGGPEAGWRVYGHQPGGSIALGVNADGTARGLTGGVRHWASCATTVSPTSSSPASPHESPGAGGGQAPEILEASSASSLTNDGFPHRCAITVFGPTRGTIPAVLDALAGFQRRAMSALTARLAGLIGLALIAASMPHAIRRAGLAGGIGAPPARLRPRRGGRDRAVRPHRRNAAEAVDRRRSGVCACRWA